ncbi:MAG TPA: hypothetical protein VHQ92_01000 [Pseudolabrys sp.]|jgi:hypothetical protein|nr:hypothetical protein [Pseudolabrys sp.]
MASVQTFGPAQPYNVKVPDIVSPVDMLQAQGLQQTNALRGLQIQAQTQAQQQQNALMALSQQPGMRDDQGLPTPQFINALAGVNPTAANAAAKLRSDTLKGQAEIANWSAQAQEHKAKTAERLGKVAYDLDQATLGSYMAAIEAGQSEQDARQTAATVRQEKYDAAVKSGIAEGLKPPGAPVDPVALKGNLFKWETFQKEKMQAAKENFQMDLQNVRDTAAEKRTVLRENAIASRQGSDVPALDDQTLDFAAQKYNLTGVLPPMGQGKAGADLKRQIMSRAAEQAATQGQSPGDVISGQAGRKADTTSLNKAQPMYDAVRSFSNNAIANGQRLIALAEKADATGVPAIERWIRAGKKATGDPDVAALNAQMTLFRNEAAKIVTNPNLTGVMTVEAQREMERSLDNAASPAQIKAVVGLLQKDFATREQSLADQIKEIKGRISNKPAASSTGKTINFSDLPP